MSNIPHNAIAAVTADELAKASSMFGTLKQLRIRLTSVDENVLDKAFEKHVQGVLEKLETRIPQLNDKQVKRAEIIMAKHGIYDAAFQQVILLCQSSDCLKDLRSTHSGFMTDLQLTVGDIVTANNNMSFELSDLKSKLRESMAECNALKESVSHLDHEAENHQKMVIELRHNLRHSKQEIENLKDLNGVNLKPLSFSSSKATDNSAARGETNGSVKGESISSSPIKSVKSSQRHSSSSNSSVFRMSSLAPSVTSDNWITVFRSEMQRALDNGRCRVMTLNECKETVEKIIEGKKAMNAKVLENSNIGNNPVMVLETIEQYYYRSLEQKYGLRNLAVEHAGVLLSSVEKYYEEDNAIHVFFKIFKNEVEEDFWIVQHELTKSIRDLLAVQIMGRYPNKDQSSLNTLLDQKMNGVITENEWTDITNYLYSNSDSMALGIILKRSAREDMKAKGQGKESSKLIHDPKRLGYISPSVHKSVITSKLNQGNDGNDNLAARIILKLSFASFLKIVLDFQLRSHVQYLDFFQKTFMHFDTDLDGVLNANEFKEFFFLLRKGTSAVGSRVHVDDNFDSSFRSLLKIVDPLDSGKIIFSFAASCLSQLIAGI